MFGYLQCYVKHKLLNCYCSSFYGSQTWDLTSVFIKDICIAWHKAVKRVWNLPAKCHTDLLQQIIGQLYILQQFELRYLKLFFCMLNNENDTIAFIARRALWSTGGVLGRNNVFIANKYNVQLKYSSIESVKAKMEGRKKQDASQYTGSMIRELCLVRDCVLTLNGLGPDDINIIDLIDELCTS